jgi:hypothetical protein
MDRFNIFSRLISLKTLSKSYFTRCASPAKRLRVWTQARRDLGLPEPDIRKGAV